MKLHEATAPTKITGPLRLARLINEAQTLSGGEKDLLRAMLQWVNPQTLCLHPSVMGLARAIGKSDRTVQRLLRSLENKAAITTIVTKGGSPKDTNRVRLNPSAWTFAEPLLWGEEPAAQIVEAKPVRVLTDDTHVTGHVTGQEAQPVTPVSPTGDTHVTRTSKIKQKQQQGGASGSSEATASNAPQVAAAAGVKAGGQERQGVRQALILAGIGSTTLDRLAHELRLSPDQIGRVAESARSRGKGTGVIVRDLEAENARQIELANRRQARTTPTPLRAPEPAEAIVDDPWERAARGLTDVEVATLMPAAMSDGALPISARCPKRSRRAAVVLGKYLERLAPYASAVRELLMRLQRDAVTPEEREAFQRGDKAIRAAWPSAWCLAHAAPVPLNRLGGPDVDPWEAFSELANAAGAGITAPKRVLEFAAAELETSGAQKTESGNLNAPCVGVVG